MAAAFRVLVAEIKVRGWRGGWWINNILVIYCCAVLQDPGPVNNFGGDGNEPVLEIRWQRRVLHHFKYEKNNTTK